MPSATGKEKIAARLGRVGSEFATAVKDALLPELQQHTKLLFDHSERLDRHEQALKEIVSILRVHSGMLGDHNERLARLETRAESFERSVNQRFESLERTVNQRFESFERSMDRGFSLLSDRIGDLAGEIRGVLELRDRVSKIEARLGMSQDH